jgi:hypothetical protein
MARMQAVVTAVKVCSRECCVGHCHLPWNGQRLLRTPILTKRHPSFEHLIACAILWWRVSGRLLYNIFDMLFNKESYYGQIVCEFHFTLYNTPQSPCSAILPPSQKVSLPKPYTRILLRTTELYVCLTVNPFTWPFIKSNTS